LPVPFWIGECRQFSTGRASGTRQILIFSVSQQAANAPGVEAANRALSELVFMVYQHEAPASESVSYEIHSLALRAGRAMF
jgi:hypothetical protein